MKWSRKTPDYDHADIMNQLAWVLFWVVAVPSIGLFVWVILR